MVTEEAPHVAEEQDPAPWEVTVGCSEGGWHQGPASVAPFWSVLGRTGHLGHHVESPLADQEVPEVVVQVATAAALDQVALEEEPAAQAVQEVPVEEALEVPPEVVAA